MSSSEKKFLTYNQQMKHLRESKHIVCNGSLHKEYLCRNGYFNLINGYKDPFIIKKNSDGSNSYFPGTSIEEIHCLKNFDENLRLLLLRYITKAEEEIRTFAAYKFDQYNDKGSIRWYEIKAYDNSNNIDSIIKSISIGYKEISSSQLSYVAHYLKCYKTIPTWVYFKVIRFSSFIDLLKISKKDVGYALCNLYKFLKSDGNIYFKLLISSLQSLRKVRNQCAHNERVYDFNIPNARIKEPMNLFLRPVYVKERSQKIIDVLVFLKYYLDNTDYLKLINDFEFFVKELKDNISSYAFERVRSSMGIKQLEDINLLKNVNKKKDYNKF